MIKAQCHCGDVKITLNKPDNSVTACNCSICRRYATLWSYGTPDTISINAPEGGLQDYMWGDKEIAFVRCASCACVTHWESRSPDQPAQIAVNMRNAAPEVLKTLEIRHFDGADTWTYLD